MFAIGQKGEEHKGPVDPNAAKSEALAQGRLEGLGMKPGQAKRAADPDKVTLRRKEKR